MNKCTETKPFFLKNFENSGNLFVKILGIPENPLCSFRIQMKAQANIVKCDNSNNIIMAGITVRTLINFFIL